VDTIDRQIIAELTDNARLSNIELADRIGLTPAPCLRRVKRLEADGVITGYTICVDPAALQRGFEVMVNVDLLRKDKETVETFEAIVGGFEEVVELRRMFGLPDYFLRVATETMDSYEAFCIAKLGAVPGVAKMDSHLTMKAIKTPR
jgi:DNA-binding Lrp family transcriptional regulator